jgi:hypothetical protein
MGDLAESLGGALMPAIMGMLPMLERGAKLFEIIAVPVVKLIGWLAGLIAQFWEWLVPLDAVEGTVGTAVEYVTQFATMLGEYLAPVLQFVKIVLTDVMTAVIATAGAIIDYMAPIITSIIETLTSWADTIWSYLKPALLWIGNAGIVVFTALQTAIQNFGDVAMIAIEAFALGVVKAFNIVVYTLTDVVPAYLSWFGRNWKAIFNDIWEFSKTVFSNMTKNISAFFSAVAGWFRGEGFNFEWTSLTKGFEKTMEDLPKIAARVKGEIETNLEVDIAKRGTRVKDAFTENLEKNRKMITDTINDAKSAAAKVGGPAAPGKPESAATGTGLDMSGDEEAGGKKDKKDSKQGTIVGLMDLNRSITEAAAKSMKEDKQTAATKEAARMNAVEQQKTRDEIQKSTTELKNLNTNTAKIAAEIGPVGALANG